MPLALRQQAGKHKNHFRFWRDKRLHGFQRAPDALALLNVPQEIKQVSIHIFFWSLSTCSRNNFWPVTFMSD